MNQGKSIELLKIYHDVWIFDGTYGKREVFAVTEILVQSRKFF